VCVWVRDSTAETTRAGVNQKIDVFVEGGLEHASEIILALLEIVNKAPPPPPPIPAVRSSWCCLLSGVVLKCLFHPQAGPSCIPEWSPVNAALIKSIRKGVFFDREYWARHSNTGDLFKPVYFSSAIMNDKAQQLEICMSKLISCRGDVLSLPSGKVRQG
jgi:hypothetical protein